MNQMIAAPLDVLSRARKAFLITLTLPATS